MHAYQSWRSGLRWALWCVRHWTHLQGRVRRERLRGSRGFGSV